jgi:hypothetical protein
MLRARQVNSPQRSKRTGSARTSAAWSRSARRLAKVATARCRGSTSSISAGRATRNDLRHARLLWDCLRLGVPVAPAGDRVRRVPGGRGPGERIGDPEGFDLWKPFRNRVRADWPPHATSNHELQVGATPVTVAFLAKVISNQ